MRHLRSWIALAGLLVLLMGAPPAVAGSPARAPIDDQPVCVANLSPLPAVRMLSGPSRVSITQAACGLLWTVNQVPVQITGMNYNVDYTMLPEETRRALHRRDLLLMQAVGVNAIVGWGIYDEVTLQVAQEFGIGVIMPFDLDPRGAYETREYVEEIQSEFRDYVNRFKHFPAVWAWNPGGDELLYRMDSEEHRTSDKIQPAANLLVDLAALAYSIDPNHVSVIKEPRDFYVPALDAAIKQLRAQSPQTDPGKFIVYGVNVYGHPDDVAAALEAAKKNAETRMGVALLVTEFGPNQLPYRERAGYYGLLWDAVNAWSPNGGLVYVFGPDQPNPDMKNPYDALHLLPNEYTLVDNQGNPVDDSLCVVAGRYHSARQGR